MPLTTTKALPKGLLNLIAGKSRVLRRFIFAQAALMLVLISLLGVTDWLDLPHHWLSYWGDPGWLAWVIQLGIVSALAIGGTWLFRSIFLELRLLEGLLHVCAGCRKIRANGTWQPIEVYLMEHSHAQFSHGFCPECLERLYPEVMASIRNNQHTVSPAASPAEQTAR